jgi:O-antigen ligase
VSGLRVTAQQVSPPLQPSVHVPLSETGRLGYVHRSAIKQSKLFLVAVFWTMALSSLVIIEPAPVDLLLIGLFAFGAVAGFLEFSSIAPLALIPLTGFVATNITSMYDPLDFVHATFYVGVTIYLALSWIFFASFFTRYGASGVRSVFQGWMVAALICVALGLLSYFHIIGFQDYLLRFGRPKGIFKDPNVFGPYLVPLALATFAGLTFKPGTKLARIAVPVTVAILTFGVLVSYSRAAWINFVISVAVYFVLATLIRPTGSPLPFPVGKAIAALVLAVFGIGLGLQIPAVQSMMAQRVTSNGLQNYDRDRFRTHHLAMQAAIDRPLGIGPGQAEETFQYATHSSYMRAISENGITGLVCYSAFILICFGVGIHKVIKTTDPFWRKVYLVAVACIVGHAVNSAVVDTIHWRHYWLILALPFVPAPRSQSAYAAPQPR